MRAVTRPMAIILTKAHRDAVSMMTRGVLAMGPAYCPLGFFYFCIDIKNHQFSISFFSVT